MVCGHPGAPDCRAFTFIEAARETGIKPDVMRRYLDRPDVRAPLLSERRALRAAICGGNEGALLRVRETAQNGMAVVAAVRALEESRRRGYCQQRRHYRRDPARLCDQAEGTAGGPARACRLARRRR
jgi:hypothetical protein